MSEESAADFMHSELEALLASPALQRVAERHTDSDDAPLSQARVAAREAKEATIDQQALRYSLRAGLK